MNLKSPDPTHLHVPVWTYPTSLYIYLTVTPSVVYKRTVGWEDTESKRLIIRRVKIDRRKTTLPVRLKSLDVWEKKENLFPSLK